MGAIIKAGECQAATFVYISVRTVKYFDSFSFKHCTKVVCVSRAKWNDKHKTKLAKYMGIIT